MKVGDKVIIKMKEPGSSPYKKPGEIGTVIEVLANLCRLDDDMLYYRDNLEVVKLTQTGARQTLGEHTIQPLTIKETIMGNDSSSFSDKHLPTIKSCGISLYNQVKPYEKYLLAVAALVALDHFILKGKGRKQLAELAGKLADKLHALVDSAIDRIGG